MIVTSSVTGLLRDDGVAPPEVTAVCTPGAPHYRPHHASANECPVRAVAVVLSLHGPAVTEHVLFVLSAPSAFVVPPPKAEEMYMPETFGRGGSDRVIVE